MIKDRIFLLGLILMIRFLLLTSFVLTALITTTTDWISEHFPNFIIYIIQVINFILSFILTIVLFTLMFKILPDIKMKWKGVWLDTFVTTILFSIRKSALGIYFGTVNSGSTFGAAESVIFILLWVSYSSLILFFGTEFTQVIALKYGSEIQPESYVEKVS